MEFSEQLQKVQQGGIVNAQQISIDLSIVQIDNCLNLSGNYFYILDAPDQTSYIEVKTNATNQPAISWVKQTGFNQAFTKLYITTPVAQTGTMIILIASLAPELFAIIDNRSAISEAMNDVLEQLRGDIAPETFDTEKTVGVTAVQVLAANANRKGCCVQAKSTNTGIIYLGFTNLVTSSKWFAELQPGMSRDFDDYRGDIYAIATIAAQLAGFGEW